MKRGYFEKDPGQRRYPFVVIRYMPAVYGMIPVEFVPAGNEPRVNPKTFTIVEPEPFKQGKLTESCRWKLIETVKAASAGKGFRMCIVFGPKEALYVEPDGRMKESDGVPGGGMWLS